jgi:hypothetical protein
MKISLISATFFRDLTVIIGIMHFADKIVNIYICLVFFTFTIVLVCSFHATTSCSQLMT